MLFRNLPAPDAHELVSISQTVEGGESYARAGSGTFSASEYRDYRDRAQTLSGLLAHGNPRTTALGGGAPQEIAAGLLARGLYATYWWGPASPQSDVEKDAETDHDWWT